MNYHKKLIKLLKLIKKYHHQRPILIKNVFDYKMINNFIMLIQYPFFILLILFSIIFSKSSLRFFSPIFLLFFQVNPKFFFVFCTWVFLEKLPLAYFIYDIFI